MDVTLIAIRMIYLVKGYRLYRENGARAVSFSRYVKNEICDLISIAIQ